VGPPLFFSLPAFNFVNVANLDFAAWADFAVRWNFETTYRTHFMRKCGAPPLLYIFAPHSAANFVGQDLF
jgi:hypothetical protein